MFGNKVIDMAIKNRSEKFLIELFSYNRGQSLCGSSFQADSQNKFVFIKNLNE
jgi:hypothetical protein